MENENDYVIDCSSQKGRISDMKVVEDFESRPHTQRGHLCSRKRRGKTGMERAKREEGEEDEGSGERQVKNEKMKEVISRSSQILAFEDCCKNDRKTGGNR